jgi:RES domain-containing protein
MGIGCLPVDYLMMTIHIPDTVAICKLNAATLPAGWNVFPAIPHTKAIGAAFVLKNKFAVMQVPSAVTQGDLNYLLNTQHPDFLKISILARERFLFDRRLFR